MMFLDRFSTISQTYMMNEALAAMEHYDVRIISTKPAPVPCVNHPPYELITDEAEICERILEFRPHVFHAHYLHWGPRIAAIAERFRIPFTLRAHSFDTIKAMRRKPRFGFPEVHAANSDACAGILAFPFARPRLEKLGIPPERIVDSYPVVNFARFYDRSPNGDAVLNVGACIPKKRMQDFVDLGKLTSKKLNLYPIGGITEKVRTYNERSGLPINVRSVVEPEEMPAVYKAHGWLVYTACFEMKTVGWPMAVAEAQAAGVGICFPNIRPDLADYVGEAGFLYDSISEVADIIARPYPEEMREQGFIQARKSDIFTHQRQLGEIWDRVSVQPPRMRWPGRFTVYKKVNNTRRTIRRAFKSDRPAARTGDGVAGARVGPR